MGKLFFLGIQSYASHDSGASIICLNKENYTTEHVCISEERLSRNKHPYTFPYLSIQYCLDYFGLKDINKIDYIISDWIKEKKWLRSGPSYNYSMFDYLKEKFKYKKKIYQIDHHLAHAASVFYTSSFKESAILIVDGLGSDLETTSFFYGKDKKINLLKKYTEHGIGSFYGAITSNILNFGTGGEGKTMGLAPYGKKYKGQLKLNYNLKDIENNFSNYMKRLPLSDVLNQIDDNYRPNPLKFKHKKCSKKNHLNSYFSGVAYDVQNISEKTMIHLGKSLFEKTKSKNICIAGGVGLNSVANKKLLDNTKFKNISVFPACSDAGIPFGCALWGLYNLVNSKVSKKITFYFNNAYTGKIYDPNSTINLLKKTKIKYKKTNPKEIATLIANGKIIARCAGKSEYGPRALGNRSILADARNKKMRDYLNIRIKHREIFRPFAPIVLEEEYKKYFDLNQSSPYMLLVANCKKSNIIPSAVHVDKTARVQTVNEIQNKYIYQIIKNFKKITNVPVILNTSFNDAGEPMVETPLDAIICFLQTGIDYLVVDDLILNKNNINKKLIYPKLVKLRKKLLSKSDKVIKRKLFSNINLKSYFKKKRQYDHLAIHRAIHLSREKIKDFIKKNQNGKILFYGTKDHTFYLEKFINKNNLLGENLFFLEYKKRDFLTSKFNLNLKKCKNIKNFDYIVVSSFEYQKDILQKLEKMDIKAKVFVIYDSSSRSLIDSLWIEKYKNKKKIFDKGPLSKF